jgi:hypothetical protein
LPGDKRERVTTEVDRDDPGAGSGLDGFADRQEETRHVAH